MKTTALALLFLGAIQVGWAARLPAKVRTIKDLRDFPVASFRSQVNHQLYRSIEVSPVEAWLVARAPIFGGKTASAKILHSEGNGIYDKMLLELASAYSVTGAEHTESRVNT
jgi:hypothetical protein